MCGCYRHQHHMSSNTAANVQHLSNLSSLCTLWNFMLINMERPKVVDSVANFGVSNKIVTVNVGMSWPQTFASQILETEACYFLSHFLKHVHASWHLFLNIQSIYAGVLPNMFYSFVLCGGHRGYRHYLLHCTGAIWCKTGQSDQVAEFQSLTGQITATSHEFFYPKMVV